MTDAAKQIAAAIREEWGSIQEPGVVIHHRQVSWGQLLRIAERLEGPPIAEEATPLSTYEELRRELMKLGKPFCEGTWGDAEIRAGLWLDKGFTVDTARPWWLIGVYCPSTARHCVDAGRTPEQVAARSVSLGPSTVIEMACDGLLLDSILTDC